MSSPFDAMFGDMFGDLSVPRNLRVKVHDVLEYDGRRWFVIAECPSIVGGALAVEVGDDGKPQYGSPVHLVADQRVLAAYRARQQWSEARDRMAAVVDAQPTDVPEMQGFARRGLTTAWMALSKSKGHPESCVAIHRRFQNEPPRSFDPDRPLEDQLCHEHRRWLVDHENPRRSLRDLDRHPYVVDTTAEPVDPDPDGPPCTGTIKLGEDG